MHYKFGMCIECVREETTHLPTVHGHAAVKTDRGSKQTRKLHTALPLTGAEAAANTYRSRQWVHQDLDTAPPTRFAVGRAKERCPVVDTVYRKRLGLLSTRPLTKSHVYTRSHLTHRCASRKRRVARCS